MFTAELSRILKQITNTFSDHFFSKEALSEVELVRKFGKNDGRSYQKKSDGENEKDVPRTNRRKNSNLPSNTDLV